MTTSFVPEPADNRFPAGMTSKKGNDNSKGKNSKDRRGGFASVFAVYTLSSTFYTLPFL
jgi:hypothetical protein